MVIARYHVKIVAIERLTVWFIAKIAARLETATAGRPVSPNRSKGPFLNLRAKALSYIFEAMLRVGNVA